MQLSDVARLATREDRAGAGRAADRTVVEPRMATALTLEVPVAKTSDLPRRLGSLGYPGFVYLADPRAVLNPAALVLAALRAPAVPARHRGAALGARDVRAP